MGMWNLGNGQYFNSSQRLEGQDCFNSVVVALTNGTTTFDPVTCCGLQRISTVSVTMGQVIIEEKRNYINSAGDINQFFLLKSITYKVTYNG